MKTLKVIGMVPLILIAATAFSQGDNRAVPRGGGGGGGSSAGSRHTGGGGSPSQGAPNRGGSSASGGGSAYSQSGAAGRRPRPGTGTGTRDRYGNEYNRYGYYGNYGYYGGYYGGYYPYSYYYSPYAYWGYPSYGYGLGFSYYDGYPYGGYYGGYAPAPYYGGSYGPPAGAVAQVRTLIDPPNALVYVDGRYVGTADDFDGLFQRLTISPGRHDITLKLEGYTSHTYSVYAAPDETLKLRLDMVKGTGETKETVGEDYERWAENDRKADREREMAREAERDRESARGREVDSNPADRPSITLPGGGLGQVLLEIEPPDASVYVDGEFRGKASRLARLELPIGRHRVEVVRPGYRTTETVISVESEARKLVLKLER